MREAIFSMAMASAPGPDGLRVSHLRQMLSEEVGEEASRLSQTLDLFASVITSGRVPDSIRPYFFGARLVALSKQKGSIRPIAIGQCLRRAICRAVCIQMREVSTKLLEPYQLGDGSRDGATAAAHAARRFLNSGGCGFVKIDFRNAFNELSRSALLEAVMRLTPELFRLDSCVYGRDSFLFYENDIIRSERGVQQGDPLGPLLFALALRDLAHNSIAPFAVY